MKRQAAPSAVSARSPISDPRSLAASAAMALAIRTPHRFAYRSGTRGTPGGHSQQYGKVMADPAISLPPTIKPAISR